MLGKAVPLYNRPLAHSSSVTFSFVLERAFIHPKIGSWNRRDAEFAEKIKDL